MDDEQRIRAETDGYPVDIPPCSRCGSTVGEFFKMFSGPHYAKVNCICGLFIRWERNPDKEEPKRKSKPRLRPDIEYCELCGRLREELDGRATIEEHHVKEVKDWPELEREASNIWVLCTRCHLLLHTIRHMVKGKGLLKGETAA